jgi:hypothetical protein
LFLNFKIHRPNYRTLFLGDDNLYIHLGEDFDPKVPNLTFFELNAKLMSVGMGNEVVFSRK